MASTSATGPPPEVLEEINLLFSWNPPRLIPAPKTSPSKKASTATRSPAFYDKHFSPDLVVKKVVWLPSLVQDPAGNVDKVLGALETLPPLEDFITAKQRAIDRRVVQRVVANEVAVVELYGRTTAKYCLFVASTLALHPSAPSSDYAIMDGRLLFFEEADDDDDEDDEDKKQRAAIVESMDSEVRAIFEEVRKTRLPLATWEMKSLSTGSPEVMTAIRNLDEFSWTFCTANDCNTNPNHLRQNVLVNLAKGRVGPDAQTTQWNLPGPVTQSAAASVGPHAQTTPSSLPGPATQSASVIVGPHTQTTPSSLPGLATRRITQSASASVGPHAQTTPSSFPGPATQRITRSAAASSSLMVPLPLPRAPRGSSIKNKGKKRARDDEEDQHDTAAQSGSSSSMLPPPPPPPSASRSSKLGSPAKDRGKKPKLDQDKHEITAEKIVQQAWAQAIRVDGTVIILHSGNQELVCVRHRHSQTLYVSGVFEPSRCKNPGYGKLHIGIYVATIQDAMDRWRQKLSESKLPGDGDDQDHNRGFGSGCEGSHELRRSRGRGGHSGFQSSAGREGPTDDELVAIEKAIDVANNRDMVLLYLQYDIYDSQIPASFLRSAPSIMTHTRSPTPPFSSRAIHSYGLEDCLTIVLTSEIGRGATGVVHRGTLKPEICDGVMPLDVVVKLAFDSEQRDALKSEYEVYRCLKSKGVRQGIATALGFFDDSEGCACALVLLYAGVSLSESQGNLSGIDRKSALSTLKSIHRAGMLHGDIRRANILTGDLGVTIIDFGHSERCDDKGAKGKELAQLRSCFGLEGKHY